MSSLELVYTKKNKNYTLPRVAVGVVDTHAHVLGLPDPALALARAACAGVNGIVVIWDPASDAGLAHTPNSVSRVLEHARSSAAQLLTDEMATVLPVSASSRSVEPPVLRFLAGVHPYDAEHYTNETEEILKAALCEPWCAGIGEIGLDYHYIPDADGYVPAPRELQREVMERQLAVAIEHQVPVELHIRNDAGDTCRSAHQDALEILAASGIPHAGCVLHCFGEDRATMERFCALGCTIAFGGAATFKRNTEVREAFASCPTDQFVFETDCPYMAPEPLRGLACEPAMIVQTAAQLCQQRSEITKEPVDALLHAAQHNAYDLFFGDC